MPAIVVPRRTPGTLGAPVASAASEEGLEVMDLDRTKCNAGRNDTRAMLPSLAAPARLPPDGR